MKILLRSQVLVLALLLFPLGRAVAQGTREDYQRAEQFLAGNLRHRIYVADVARIGRTKESHCYCLKKPRSNSEVHW